MKNLITIFTFAFTAVGCSTITVSQRHDESENFTRFRSYAWMEEAKVSGTLPFDEPAARRTIKREVEKELHYKGFRIAPVDEADFLIGYQVALDRQLSANDVATNYEFNQIETDPNLIGTVQTDSSARPQTYIRTYDQGALILNIADAKTKELVWWSSAQAEVNATDSAAVRQKRITKAVGKLLENFPPK